MKNERTVSLQMENGQVFDVPLTCLSAEDAAFAKSASAGDVRVQISAAAPLLASAARAPRKPGDPARPASTLRLSGVHLCCEACVESVSRVGLAGGAPLPPGVSLRGDLRTRTITVRATREGDLRTALGALLAAGFHGESDHPSIAPVELGPSAGLSDSMIVRGARLGCRGSVSAFTRAAESVEGVQSCKAVEGATTALIAGQGFDPRAVMEALRDAGFGGSYR